MSSCPSNFLAMVTIASSAVLSVYCKREFGTGVILGVRWICCARYQVEAFLECTRHISQSSLYSVQESYTAV